MRHAREHGATGDRGGDSKINRDTRKNMDCANILGETTVGIEPNTPAVVAKMAFAEPRMPDAFTYISSRLSQVNVRM